LLEIVVASLPLDAANRRPTAQWAERVARELSAVVNDDQNGSNKKKVMIKVGLYPGFFALLY
jgi:hypothetical protein